MLELVEPLLQADLLHLQQGAILDFIQREAMLLSKVTDQRVLRAGQALRRAGAQPPPQAPTLQLASESLPLSPPVGFIHPSFHGPVGITH